MNTQRKSKNLLYYSSAIFTITLLCFSGLLAPLNSSQIDENDNSSIINIKSSGFWFLNTTNIHVDGNWSATETAYSWVSGSGSWADPYLVENVTIDGKDANSTIIIENSAKYFRIKNCTLYNATETGINGGIILNNVTNGEIIDCEIISSGYGIWMNDTSNITISDGFYWNNKNDSIYLMNSSLITITGGVDLYNNTGHGVYFNNSDNNTIAYSVIRNNDLYGVYLDENSSNNWIYENYVGYNKYDKVIENSLNVCYYIINNGQDNRIYNNDEVGSCVPSKIYGTLPPGDPSYDWLIYTVAGVAIIVILGFLNKKYKESSQRKKEAPAKTDVVAV
jgi:hypothetical protein